jgi:hypothetical protein
VPSMQQEAWSDANAWCTSKRADGSAILRREFFWTAQAVTAASLLPVQSTTVAMSGSRRFSSHTATIVVREDVNSGVSGVEAKISFGFRYVSVSQLQGSRRLS